MNTQNATSWILIYSFVMTAIALIVLFALGIVPLWLAAVIIVADAILGFFLVNMTRADRGV